MLAQAFLRYTRLHFFVREVGAMCKPTNAQNPANQSRQSLLHSLRQEQLRNQRLRQMLVGMLLATQEQEETRRRALELHEQLTELLAQAREQTGAIEP